MYRLLSHYVEFLLGLKQMRPRLLVILAVLGAMCGSLMFKEGAPLPSRVFLGVVAGVCILALLGALWCALLGYTLFTRDASVGAAAAGPVGGSSPPQGGSPAGISGPSTSEGGSRAISHLEPLAEGQGEAARVSGDLGNGRHRQVFKVTAGGILREGDQLHLVVPAEAFQVIGGVNTDACRNWWRCTVDRDVLRVEVGSLWIGGRALPALRFVRGRFDRLTVATIDPRRFARVLETVRALEYPLV